MRTQLGCWQVNVIYSERVTDISGGKCQVPSQGIFLYGQALFHCSLGAAKSLGYSFIFGKEQGYDQEKEESKPNPLSCI